MSTQLTEERSSKATPSNQWRYGYPRIEVDKRRRELNWPLLLATLLALGIAVPATYFWHRYQVNQLSKTFLSRIVM